MVSLAPSGPMDHESVPQGSTNRVLPKSPFKEALQERMRIRPRSKEHIPMVTLDSDRAIALDNGGNEAAALQHKPWWSSFKNTSSPGAEGGLRPGQPWPRERTDSVAEMWLKEARETRKEDGAKKVLLFFMNRNENISNHGYSST